MIKIEVAYATPEKQLIVELDIEEGLTLRQAALLSGLDHEFTGLEIESAALGLFGRKVPKPDEELVKAGDRIEIYRPLIIDPKQARLNRAAKAVKK